MGWGFCAFTDAIVEHLFSPSHTFIMTQILHSPHPLEERTTTELENMEKKYCMVPNCKHIATLSATLKFKRLKDDEGLELTYCPNHEKTLVDFKRRQRTATHGRLSTRKPYRHKLRCKRCRGEWRSYEGNPNPKRCRFCRNPYWSSKRKNENE